jgi:DNA invertase Pin-like site-specific DNA recombinase
MIAVVKPGEIVVVYRLDRFSRNTMLGLAAADAACLRTFGSSSLSAGGIQR